MKNPGYVKFNSLITVGPDGQTHIRILREVNDHNVGATVSLLG